MTSQVIIGKELVRLRHPRHDLCVRGGQPRAKELPEAIRSSTALALISFAREVTGRRPRKLLGGEGHARVQATNPAWGDHNSLP